MKKVRDLDIWPAYVILHRWKGMQRSQRSGLYSDDLERLRRIARKDAESGRFSRIRIIESKTGKTVETIL